MAMASQDFQEQLQQEGPEQLQPGIQDRPRLQAQQPELCSSVPTEPLADEVGQYGLTSEAVKIASNQSHGVREKRMAVRQLQGCTLGECGVSLLQSLLEVLPLRSKHTGTRNKLAMFPLPTSRSVLFGCCDVCDGVEVSWLLCVVLSLNSLWGDELHFDGAPNDVQLTCIKQLLESVRSLVALPQCVEDVDWSTFFQVRSIDYQGEEVKVARWISWESLEPALPAEIGRVPLLDVCTLGCKHYVECIDQFLVPEDEWSLARAPKVMVEDTHWGSVCQGLVRSGICVLLEEDEVFHVNGVPLLNGLFGVSKDEYTEQGVEVMRLIMNLIPFNRLCKPLTGDVETLPSWSLMSPFFLQPSQNLLVSSEDVKCFFYTMSLPSTWWKYLAFNKPVPDSALPLEQRGRSMYLASRVLPMGFLNSVSLAQHVHRNLVTWSSESQEGNANPPSAELRKDLPFTVQNPLWRVYLDNFDLLEKVEATEMVEKSGTMAPGVLALRQQYEHWDIPRNVKKSVLRSAHCEMQGATIDGVRGIAFPREVKLCKYFALGYNLAHSSFGNQKQWQVVCGGLVYFAMFRRPLLGSLNRVWAHIEEFTRSGQRSLSTPEDCRVEVLRFLGLLPLAQLDFRLGMHSQVTCSDASSTGGGICASRSTTAMGSLVALGGLRGEAGVSWETQGVLVVGMFDGIGAVRVALDLLGVRVLGYISVEKSSSARRVVESHYPGVVCLDYVEDISDEHVVEWALKFSQCSCVLLGAGPPCQGVSGLNADRKGALKDARSSLFSHVPRVRNLLRRHFRWCPVYTLMESVSSMDGADRTVMSEAYGGEPYHCDAGAMTWVHRPRLYWLDWEIIDSEGVSVHPTTDGSPSRITMVADQPLSQVLRKGWKKVDLTKSFPTFTTARPSDKPGRKPAGIRQCSDEELERWHQDRHRFPPYQYCTFHCVQNSKGQFRLPDIQERELLMGFPLNYTSACYPKGQRTGCAYEDCRLTLLGNTWSVPVVAVLLGQLFHRLGFCPQATPQKIVDHTFACNIGTIQGRLLRLPLNPQEKDSEDQSSSLAFRLGNLISVKGEDIMLITPSTQLQKFHRLRATVPGKLWKWRIIAGWRWRHGAEHINALEFRAILTALRWRIEHQAHTSTRLIHLTDSLVCLHCLCRGRSSSRKLRRTMAKVNALLLASSVQPVWGYIHTDQNPADRPSRWGRRVRTRFRNG
eukprot:Skav220899  [mRNA]  locus=scaffold3880:174086:177691:+ [translate_table: standard]